MDYKTYLKKSRADSVTAENETMKRSVTLRTYYVNDK